MEQTFFICFLQSKHFEEIIELGGQVHGDNYLSRPELDKILNLSQKDGHNCSFSLFVSGGGKEKLIGFRLTYAPGQWIEKYDKGLSAELWPYPPDKVAYFKSNTLDPEFRGLGLGRMLLDRSVAECKRQGAVAGVTHIWMQSPNNSAFKYFSRAGGKLVVLYPDYWRKDCDNGYRCAIDGADCHCTGAEMLLDFSEHKELF